MFGWLGTGLTLCLLVKFDFHPTPWLDLTGGDGIQLRPGLQIEDSKKNILPTLALGAAREFCSESTTFSLSRRVGAPARGACLRIMLGIDDP